MRIREKGDGRAEVWFKRRSGSSLFGVSPRDLEALKESQVTIEQLGADRTVVVESDQVETLLQVRELNALARNR